MNSVKIQAFRFQVLVTVLFHAPLLLGSGEADFREHCLDQYPRLLQAITEGGALSTLSNDINQKRGLTPQKLTAVQKGRQKIASILRPSTPPKKTKPEPPPGHRNENEIVKRLRALKALGVSGIAKIVAGYWNRLRETLANRIDPSAPLTAKEKKELANLLVSQKQALQWVKELNKAEKLGLSPEEEALLAEALAHSSFDSRGKLLKPEEMERTLLHLIHSKLKAHEATAASSPSTEIKVITGNAKNAPSFRPFRTRGEDGTLEEDKSVPPARRAKDLNQEDRLALYKNFAVSQSTHEKFVKALEEIRIELPTKQFNRIEDSIVDVLLDMERDSRRTQGFGRHFKKTTKKDIYEIRPQGRNQVRVILGKGKGGFRILAIHNNTKNNAAEQERILKHWEQEWIELQRVNDYSNGE